MDRAKDSPDGCVAVKAAEAAFVIHVLQGHQPLQGIDRLLTPNARLSRRGAELLNAATFTLVQDLHRQKVGALSLPADSPEVLCRGRRPLLKWTKRRQTCDFVLRGIPRPLTIALRRGGVFRICQH